VSIAAALRILVAAIAASANAGFVNASINAVGASAVVANAVGSTPEALRQEAADTARWTAVEDELRAMLKGVAETNLARRHRVGLTSLQAYGISRMLVRKLVTTAGEISA
jgi:hypothetical protein